MMRPVLLLLALAALSLAGQVERELPKDHPFYESSLGLKQLDKILTELKTSMGDIPPEVEKIAIFQIKMDRKDFPAGLQRYIQGRIETALRDEGRRSVVAPPELKTLKIISTDTSFTLSNTLPSAEELWRLGDKLRIDAFVEGSCSRTVDGDILLNLKIVRHRTGEIAWSGDFIAGPNKVLPTLFDLKWTVAVPLRFLPMKSLITGDATLDSNISDPILNQFGLEWSMAEALTQNKRLWFSVHQGFSMANFQKSDTGNMELKSMYLMQIGVGLLAVIIAKDNPDRGYWLGTYVTGTYFIPFSFSGKVPMVSVGYKSQLSRHFSIGVGAQWMPLDNTYTGTGTIPSTNGVKVKLDDFGYEINILNYTF